MRLRFRPRYIVLQDFIPLGERIVLEQKIAAALPLVSPTDAFVASLERALIEDAKDLQSRRERVLRGGYIWGLVGGGVLSIVGGIAAWLLLRRRSEQNHRKRSALTSTSASSPAALLPAQ